MRRQRAILLLAVIVGSCADPAAVDPTPAAAPRCVAPDGVDTSPNSLIDVVALLDALPRPVTVECFVESLERPLKVIASSSTFSAQPAAQGSPRVFVLYDNFVISFVPMGDGSHVLEFAEERPDARSVKAELHVPIERDITYADFTHIENSAEIPPTICGGCHHGEAPVDDIPLGVFYASEALRPSLAETVRVQDLEDLHTYCDPAFDERRCSIFSAMFDHGPVEDTDFPRALPTIYD